MEVRLSSFLFASAPVGLPVVNPFLFRQSPVSQVSGLESSDGSVRGRLLSVIDKKDDRW